MSEIKAKLQAIAAMAAFIRERMPGASVTVLPHRIDIHVDGANAVWSAVYAMQGQAETRSGSGMRWTEATLKVGEHEVRVYGGFETLEEVA